MRNGGRAVSRKNSTKNSTLTDSPAFGTLPTSRYDAGMRSGERYIYVKSKIHVERSQSYAGPPNVVLSRTQFRNPIGSPTATPGENLNDADRAQIEGVPENQRRVSAAFALQQDTSERSASPDPLGQPARSPRLKRRPCSCATAPWPVPCRLHGRLTPLGISRMPTPEARSPLWTEMKRAPPKIP